MTDRAALVTGGARRIGRAISLALHEAGYAVAIHAQRSIAEAEALRDEIVRAGGRACVLQADLGGDAAGELVEAAAGALGPLSLLVNNAASFEPDEIGALDAARFDRQMAVNLRAPLFLSEAFAAQARDGASIVNILDQRVFKPTPHFVSYTLAKSALHAATRMLAQALAPKVRVNAVAPGPTMASARQSADDFSRQSAAVPLGRGPTPAGDRGGGVYLSRRAQRDRRDPGGRRRAASRLEYARRERDRMSEVRSSDDVEFDSEVPVLIDRRGCGGPDRGARLERGRHRAGGGRARCGAVRLDRAVGRAHSGGGHAVSARAGNRGLRRRCSPTTSRARRTARRMRSWCARRRRMPGRTVEWLADTYAMPFEVITDFNYPGHSVHRMHGLPSRTGAELIDRLRGAAEAREIPILTGRVCDTLFADEDGFIEGVGIGANGARETIGCGALVLACNGYGGNAELVRRFIPEMGEALYFGHPGNQGDAVAVGRGARRAARHRCPAIRATARSRRRTTF